MGFPGNILKELQDLSSQLILDEIAKIYESGHVAIEENGAEKTDPLHCESLIRSTKVGLISNIELVPHGQNDDRCENVVQPRINELAQSCQVTPTTQDIRR